MHELSYDEPVVRFVALILAMMGPPAFEPLADALATMRSDVRPRWLWRATVLAIAGTGDPRVSSVLSRLSPDDRESIRLVEYYRAANTAFGDALLKVLSDTSSDERGLAAVLMGHRRIAAAVPRLVPLLNDADVNLQWIAALALAKVEIGRAHV